MTTEPVWLAKADIIELRDLLALAAGKIELDALVAWIRDNSAAI